MSDSGCEVCCRCCFSFIITSGLTALFLWLSLSTSNPICSIQRFYVPAMNKTLNTTSNHTISFDLKLDNQNKGKGIYYDPLNLTFYYGPNTSFPIADYVVDGFYQGHNKKARRKDDVDGRGVPWDEAFRAVLNGSKVVFRVDLVTAVRFKIMVWKTKKHKLELKAIVEVSDTGEKVNKKGIRLRSGAPEVGCYGVGLGLLALFVVLVLAS